MVTIAITDCNVTTCICHHFIIYTNKRSEDRQEICTWLPLQSLGMKSLSVTTIFSEVCFQSKARSIIKEITYSSITLLAVSRQIAVASENNIIWGPKVLFIHLLRVSLIWEKRQGSFRGVLSSKLVLLNLGSLREQWLLTSSLLPAINGQFVN